MLKYTVELNEPNDLDNLLWSGARDKWDSATNEQKDEVFWRLEDIFDSGAKSITEINDYIWFCCDDIFYAED